VSSLYCLKKNKKDVKRLGEKRGKERKKEERVEVGVETGGDTRSHEVSLMSAGTVNIREQP